MNRKTKDYIKNIFDYPTPKRTEEFFDLLRPRNAGLVEILLTQISFISFRMWVLSLIILIVLLFGCHRVSADKIYIIDACLPYIAAVGLMETNRSYRYKMFELEKSTRFSLRTVMYARMLIIGIVNYSSILFISGFIAMKNEKNMIFVFSELIIPYLITMALGLRIERHSVGRNNKYISLVVACSISIIVMMLNILDEIPINLLFHEKTIVIDILIIPIVFFESLNTINTFEGGR